VPDKRGSAVLRPSDGQNPLTGTNTLNTSYPYHREVYNVVKTSRLTETDIKLAFVNVPTANPPIVSKICANTTTITNFGFGVDSNCGATTLTGKN
jgi:hypothetical protein